MLTQEQINERLDDIWEFCSFAEYTQGLLWYPHARLEMQKHDLHHKSFRDCEAVAIAAWNNTWRNTLRLADGIVAGVGGSVSQRRAYTYGLLRRQQPKSFDFASALHGDTAFTPIDRWMIRAMGGTEKKLSWNKYVQYDWAFNAWIESRINMGRIPRSLARCDIQAIVWCVVRGKSN